MVPKPLLALILSLALAAPLAAQDWHMPRADEDPPESTTDDPLDDLGRELDGVMGLLFDRLQPHLDALGDELDGTMQEFAPALGEIGGLIDDIGNYERPERLPNGDILIRRRSDAPPPPPMEELQRLLPPQDPQTPPIPWHRPDTAVPPQTEL